MSRSVITPVGGAPAGLCEDSDDGEGGECDERIFSLATGPDFDLARRHNHRSELVGRPGIEPRTYGLKGSSSVSLVLWPARMSRQLRHYPLLSPASRVLH